MAACAGGGAARTAAVKEHVVRLQVRAPKELGGEDHQRGPHGTKCEATHACAADEEGLLSCAAGLDSRRRGEQQPKVAEGLCEAEE